jgi:hypothetical protein
MQKEIWRDIPGYEGLYQVSSEGRVRSLDREQPHSRYGIQRLKGKEISPTIQTGGYIGLGLHKKGSVKSYPIHKLVAIVFLDHEPSGQDVVVDHINNDKSDNRLCNLQLISSRENSSKDRKPNSGFTGVYKRKNGRYVSKIYDKKSICLGTYDTPQEAHEAYMNKLRDIEHTK